jgi:hypothetical protein
MGTNTVAEYDYCMNLGGFSNVSLKKKKTELPLIFHSESKYGDKFLLKSNGIRL